MLIAMLHTAGESISVAQSALVERWFSTGTSDGLLMTSLMASDERWFSTGTSDGLLMTSLMALMASDGFGWFQMAS